MKYCINIVFLFVIIALVFLNTSCNDKDENNPDLLGLTPKNITVDSDSTVIKVTTTNDQWLIYDIVIDGVPRDLTDSTTIVKIDDMSFKGPWFSVVINKGYKEINISLAKNDSVQRVLELAFKTVGYYDQFKVIQKGIK